MTLGFEPNSEGSTPSISFLCEVGLSTYIVFIFAINPKTLIAKTIDIDFIKSYEGSYIYVSVMIDIFIFRI